MRIVETKLYTIQELSEDSKSKAYLDFCSYSEYPWDSENRESLKEFERYFPVKVKEWSYGGCNQYINFSLQTDECIEELRGVRFQKWVVNHFWDYIFERKKYYSARSSTGRTSKIIYKPSSCPLTGFHMDETLLDPIHKCVTWKKRYDSLYELLEECLDNWIYDCSQDWEDYYSYESFQESASLNEWEFYQDGSLRGVTRYKGGWE